MNPLFFTQDGQSLNFEECELIDAIRVEVSNDDDEYTITDLTRTEATKLRDWLSAWLSTEE